MNLSMRFLTIVGICVFQSGFTTSSQESPGYLNVVLTKYNARHIPQHKTESSDFQLDNTDITEYHPEENPSAEKTVAPLNRSKREINISSSNDAISGLAEFINDNIKRYSKINLHGADRIYTDVNNCKVNDLYSFVEMSEPIKDKVLFHTGVFNITNHAGSAVDASSLPYAYPRMHTESISVMDTLGFSGAIQFPLPLMNDSTPTVNFFYAPTTKTSETICETVIIPPLKVHLSPKTRRVLEFNLYREQLQQNYRATFLVDASSTFEVSFRTIIYKRPIRFVKRSVHGNLLDFLKEMHDKGGVLNVPSLEYNYDSGRLLLKDYTVTRSVFNDFVAAVFGEEEPL